LLLRSEKRKGIMLFLKDGPKSIEEINENLDSPSTSVLPQIKKLKDNRMLLQDGKYYRLSEIGAIVAEKMSPLVGTLEVFEDNLDYWINQDMDRIPPFLLLKLGKLNPCRVIEPELNRIFEPPEEFLDPFMKSREVMRFTSYFQPTFTKLNAELLNKKANISLIVTEGFFERAVNDYPEELENFLLSENSRLFVYKGCSSLASVTVTEKFMALTMIDKKGKLDHRFLISFGKSAIEWGKELFTYYRDMSEEIKKGDAARFISVP
jgi:predicted transcriptional regulator